MEVGRDTRRYFVGLDMFKVRQEMMGQARMKVFSTEAVDKIMRASIDYWLLWGFLKRHESGLSTQFSWLAMLIVHYIALSTLLSISKPLRLPHCERA